MGTRIQFWAIATSVVLILFVISLIRKRKLREEYSIMWLACGAILIVFSIWRDLLDIIAHALGIYYAPAMLLLVGILFGVLILLHFAVVVSKQSEQIKTLAQTTALLRQKLDALGESSPNGERRG